jgi:hypothetical protein
MYHSNVTNLIHFHFHYHDHLLCLNTLHVSGVKRPSSGGTTLAVLVRVACNFSCCLVASCGPTGLLGFEVVFKGPVVL